MIRIATHAQPTSPSMERLPEIAVHIASSRSGKMPERIGNLEGELAMVHGHGQPRRRSSNRRICTLRRVGCLIGLAEHTLAGFPDGSENVRGI
jgi:hypothetical protein